MELEASCRFDGESMMQQLQDQLANLQVTADDKYYPGSVIQDLRRICVELGALGDFVVPACKTRAFFMVLSDEKHESRKTVQLCDRQGNGNPSKFEDIAARPTSYHGTQLRENATANDESAGRGKNDAGSHESALNTTSYEEPRNFDRTNENIAENVTPLLAPREVITPRTITRPVGIRLMIATQVDQTMRAKQVKVAWPK